MNPSEFRKNKPAIWKENKWNYFISFSIIVLGIFFQYFVLVTDWPESNNNGTIPNNLTEYQFASFFFIFYLIGFYGLWRIRANYNFIELNSNLPIDEKQNIINRIFEIMKIADANMTGEQITFTYKNFFFSSYRITILLAKDKFYINAQSKEDINGGMIDLGASYRLMKEIRKNIIICIETKDYTPKM